jgi:hypothetical protein
MKRSLLGTAALLCLLTAPASAGPALDAFIALMFEGAEVRHTTETANRAEEVYEGLEIRIDGDLARAGIARLRNDGGAISLSAEGVQIIPMDGEETLLDRIDLSLPTAFGELPTESLWLGEGGVRINPELCGALRTPVRVSGSGITLSPDNLIGSVLLEASVSGPDEVCLLDLTQELTGVALTDPAGMGVRISGMRIALKTPATPGLPEVATGETWSSEFSIADVEILMNGAVEVKLDRIESGTRINGDTLLPFAAAGHTRTLAKALATATLPEEQLPWADLWNGVRAVVGGGQFRVTGLEVVGPGLAALTGVTGPLDPGSRIDLSAEALKDEDGITFALNFDGTATGLVAFDFGLVTDAADPVFNTLPAGSLLASAPISLKGATLRVSDRGAGKLAEHILGSDPYQLLGEVLPDWVGTQKADLITAWVEKARDGGIAGLRAAPTVPVPVLVIGMMGLGDWGQLGASLNVNQMDE